jgi:SAM-dependent methyltransferase
MNAAPPCGHPYAEPPVSRCDLCAVRDRPHRQHWRTQAPRPKASPLVGRAEAPVVQVGYCGSLGRYKWAVVRGHTVIAGGGPNDHEATEPEAEDAAEAAKPIAGYPRPTVRHLLYHVYPRSGSRWRRPILRIREAMPLFNGRKIVAIAHDGTTEHPVMVRDALAGCGCEFVEVPNNPDRREVETFLPLFERVADLVGPEHATLYAHAKGVTRPAESTSDRWTMALEEACLDHWPLVAEHLSRFPITGPFKKLGRGWPDHESLSDWHYSGSYFWFRNDQVFTRPNWRTIDQFWGGIEPWPSLRFSPELAGCLLFEGRVPGFDLYRQDVWERDIEPALATWRAVQASTLPAPASRSLNLGCGPHSFPGWLNVDVIETDTIKPDVVVNGPRLPFADAAFGVAYLGHMLEHVAWDRVPIVLAEVRRVVRPGGEVRIVGPDAGRAILRSIHNRDKPAAESHIWEVIEDSSHYQRHEPGRDWPGARHQWTCYAERVVWAMKNAGFVDVAELPLTIEAFGETWPVVDYTNSSQCAVVGRVP